MELNRAVRRAHPETAPAREPKLKNTLVSFQHAKRGHPEIKPDTNPAPGTCSPGWKYNASKQTLHRMNCKRRSCRECGWYWSWTWRSAIAAKVERDKAFHFPPARLALTLTMAEYPDYKTVYDCFRYFWQLMRANDFPGVQYLCFPEENQAHDLIHFHLVIDKIDFMWHETVRQHWLTAQRWAGIDETAWILRVERIKKNVTAYFAKYITKTGKGKDEIPRRSNWQGRYVRASRFFFGELTDSNLPYRERKPLNRATLVASLALQDTLAAGEEIDRLYYQVRKPLASVSGFIEKSDSAARKLETILGSKWEPIQDRGRGLSPPDETMFDLLDAAGTIKNDAPFKFEKTSKRPTRQDWYEFGERINAAGWVDLETGEIKERS